MKFEVTLTACVRNCIEDFHLLKVQKCLVGEVIWDLGGKRKIRLERKLGTSKWGCFYSIFNLIYENCWWPESVLRNIRTVFGVLNVREEDETQKLQHLQYGVINTSEIRGCVGVTLV
jgi:hypothetical protein